MVDLDELVGQSPAIESVRSDLRRLLALVREGRHLPAILIQGETGTGKGLVAKLLHRHGPRARGPFVDLNCAAIPETLLEGELFGYERGAFTDARHAKPGLFQVSSGGMLFLDEVALLPESLQAKLLTVIEEQAVRRLGGTTKEAFDTWLVSATNTDLERAVRERRFRGDLYHRLAVVTVRLPPLREREGDAVLLAPRFLERACGHYGLPVKSLASDARALVASDPWPGNVRELANVAERLALLVDGPSVTAHHFDVARGVGRAPAPLPPATSAGGGEGEQLLAALEATGWNIMRTAAVLGVSRNTVRARMDRLGLRARRELAAMAPPLEAPPEHASARIATSASAAVAAIGAVRWERRHVTLLRVALAGPADASLAAGHLLSLAAEKVLGFGGRIEGLGRTLLDASFGVVPIENATRRAVSAALAVHQAVRDAARPGFGATTVVHTEQTTVGEAAAALVIDEAHRAALAGALDRLLGRARPGAVHVSAATAPFLQRHFELLVDEPSDAAAEPSFTVVRPDPTGLGAWRRLTPLVGRQAEMDLLRSRWELARRGRGQVVGLVGDPGVGKSRLLLEFTRTLDTASALVLRIATSAIEDPARRRPAAALVGALFSIEPGDGPDEIRKKVADRLAALELEASLLPPLAALLDVKVDNNAWVLIDPQQRARRMLDALRRLIVRESIARAVVVILDGLHWIDADTQVALDHLIDIVPVARILFVVAYRPEYRHGWTGKTFYTQLRIDPLPAPAADELLDDLLGGAPDLAPLKQQLLSWTEGNPFFLEEGVRTLVEMGGLAGELGSYRATGEVVPHTLPSTVEDTLAARIHRLPAEMRHVLQCGAAVGTEVAHAVLASVAGLPDSVLAESLRALEDAEFVYPVPGAPEPAHTFKHALTHLVTYRSLPPERQRALHAQILSALEVLHAGKIDAHIEALAEHAFRGEVWESAGRYLHAAGTRALARLTNRTAVDHLERAIAAFDRAEPRRDLLERAIDARLDLRYALALLGRPEQALPRLREAETIAMGLDDTRRLGRVVSFLANGLYLLGDHAGAMASARRATEIATRLDDFPTRVTADIYAGRALHALGRYHEAAGLFRGVVDALRGERANEYAGLPVLPAAYARSYLVMGLTELGEFESALATGREAVAIAEATGHLDTIQWAYYALGVAILDRGDADGAIAPLERALSICRAAELPVYVPRAAAALGHAYVIAGRPDGVGLIEGAAADGEAPSQRNQQARFLSRLAEVYTITGKVHEAAERAARARALAREHGERGCEAHALRPLALAYEAQGRPAQSTASHEGALALATELGMQPLAALCRLGLGKLQRVAGHRAAAQDHLIAAHDAFQRLEMARWLREAAAELALLA
jgi:transcriptional regulator with AAA-type ATPase domain/tetratricopeptide (TPR) repeat protein